MLFIVLNDSCLGMVKHGQALGGAEAIGTTLPYVDFALIAQAMGVRSEQIKSFEDLERVDLATLFSEGGPVLLDIRLDTSQVPPMGNRMRVLTGAALGEEYDKAI